jgi:hypothetical protein
MRLTEFTILASCCFLYGCAFDNGIAKNKNGFQEGKSSESVAVAVKKLASIGNSFEYDPGSQIQETRVVEALKLGGYSKDYFSMDDLVSLLADYDRRFGRDEFFHDAARLAYSYSDGEYAGRFEKQFPELVKIYGSR